MLFDSSFCTLLYRGLGAIAIGDLTHSFSNIKSYPLCTLAWLTIIPLFRDPAPLGGDDDWT